MLVFAHVICRLYVVTKVESSHKLWLHEKAALTAALAGAGAENAMLRAEVSRLRDLLEARDAQIFQLTGVSAPLEEF